MRVTIAVLLALALIAGQVAHGGAMVPFLALPMMILVLAAGVLAVPSGLAQASVSGPALWAVSASVGYFGWRCWVAEDQELARIDFGYLLLYASAWLATTAVVQGKRARWVLLSGVLLAALFQVGIGIYQARVEGGSPLPFWFSEDLRQAYFGRFATRVRGSFLNPNQFAWAMNLSVGLALGVASWGRISAISRIVLLYLAVMFGGMMVFSGSRGGMISALVQLLVLAGLSLFLITTTLRRHRVIAVVSLIGGAAVVALVGAVVLMNNWSALARIDLLFTPDLRAELAGQAFRQFQEHPVIGGGPGTFIYATRLFRTNGQERDSVFVHDDWLQILAEYGSVGLLFTLIAVLVVTWVGLRTMQKAIVRNVEEFDRPLSTHVGLLLGAMAAWSAGLVHSFADFNLHIPANGLLFAAVAGILCSRDGGMSSDRKWLVPTAALQTGILVVLLSGLGFYIWTYGRTDFASLSASDAFRGGQVSKAIKLAEEGLRIRPDDPRLLDTLGDANYGYEASLQMRDYWGGDLIIDDEPEVPIISSESLSEAESESYRERAAEAYLTAAAIQPMERSLKIKAARVLADLGETQRALVLAREAVVLDPMHGFTWSSYGSLLEDAGELEAALAAYEAGSIVQGPEVSIVAADDLKEDLGVAQDPSTER